MYQFFVMITGIALLAGCASIRTLGTPAQPPAEPPTTESAGQPEQTAPSGNDAEREVDALFAQPYIDPLTRYLERTEDKTDNPALRQRVRKERDRRCAEIADRYAAEPVTEQSLTTYRKGYDYSCPADVAAYASRLATLKARTQPEPDAAREPGDAAPVALSKQLNDCYLLTAIRNFSEAMKACRQPATEGDIKAQTNMALMTFALKDYANAFRWASAAAPHSAEAAHLLGQLYAEGLGVAPDADAARKWNGLARDQGYDGSKEAAGER